MTRKNIGLATTSPRPTGAARITFPFWTKGDAETLIIEQDYHQDWGTLRPPAVGTPIDLSQLNVSSYQLPSNASRCWLVEESAPADLGGGLASFTRTFSLLPQSRREPAFFTAQYPGREYSSLGKQNRAAWKEYPAVNTITAADIGKTIFGIFGGTFYSTIAAGFTGTYVNMLVPFYSRRAVLTSVSPFSVKNDNGIPFGDTILLGWGTSPSLGRTPKAQAVSGYSITEYAVGMGQAAILAAGKEKLTIIKTEAGISTETDTLSAATTPTSDEWTNLTSVGASFIAENAAVSQWIGNIYEVTTLYAPYR